MTVTSDNMKAMFLQCVSQFVLNICLYERVESSVDSFCFYYHLTHKLAVNIMWTLTVGASRKGLEKSFISAGMW